MPIAIFQKGWNFNQDGPGNRLLYHFQGCNLTCPWCSNPEGISIQGSLLADNKTLLESACNNNPNAIKNNKLERSICTVCRKRGCVENNRNLGIRLSSQTFEIDDLIAEAVRAKRLFHSNGGVTLTGGEPTLQFTFLKEFLQALKSHDINTAIETNGTHKSLADLFELIDTLIIDCKHCDNAIHKSSLGLGNEIILENIRKAAHSHARVWLRIPLIPDFNTSPADLKSFVDFIQTLEHDNLTVELLPYHEYGKIKWEQCGLPYSMSSKRIEPTLVTDFEKILNQNHIRTIRT